MEDNIRVGGGKSNRGAGKSYLTGIRNLHQTGSIIAPAVIRGALGDSGKKREN